MIAQYAYTNSSSCPWGAGAGLYASQASMSLLSSSLSQGIDTFIFGVVSNLSIRYVNWYVDGAAAPVYTQEIPDVSTTFGSDRTWHYQVPVTLANYSSTSHTLVGQATDVSGVVAASYSTIFTGTSGGAPPPTINSFSANPTAISDGQSTSLSWSVTGATRLFIDNNVGDVTGKTSISVAPSTDTTYTLTATNAAGSVIATTGVTVAAATLGNLILDEGFENQSGTPLIAPWSGQGPALIGSDLDQPNPQHSGHRDGYIYFSGTGARSDIEQTVAVSPNTVYTLTGWLNNSNNAGFTNGTFGVKAPDGGVLNQTPVPWTATYQQLTVVFNSGAHTSVIVYGGFTATASAWMHLDDVILLPGGTILPPPSITSFSAAPASIASGQSTLLSWVVTGATSLSMDNGVGDVSQQTSLRVSPTVTTLYTLTATNASGNTTAQMTVTVTETTGNQVQCNNNSGDFGSIQSAINGGGTVLISGTCQITSPLQINNAVVINGVGSASLVGNQNQILEINSNDVTVNGLIFNQGTISFGTAPYYTNFIFTHNTLENIYSGGHSNCFLPGDSSDNNHCGGPTALDGPGIIHALISDNLFQNIWGGGGYPANPDLTNGTAGMPGCGSGCQLNTWGSAAISFHGQSDVIISNNTFDKIAMDGMHLDWSAFTGNTNPIFSTHTVISDNTFTHVRRIPIEIQAQPGGLNSCPGQCNYGAQNVSDITVSGNYVHDYAFPFYDSWGASIVPGGFPQLRVLNNTLISNNDTGTTRGLASCFENSGDFSLSQGNVCAVPPAGGTSYGGWVAQGQSGSGGSPGPNGGLAGASPNATVETFQNDLACGNASLFSANGSVNGIDYDGQKVGFPTVLNQYNYLNDNSCPAGANLTISSMTAVFTSADNQKFPNGGNGIFNVSVISHLSIRHVQFFIDNSSTPVVTQEVQNVNPNFANDQMWLYQAQFNTSAYGNTTHQIKAVVTDASGAQQISQQNFIVGSGNAPLPSITTFAINPSTITMGQSATLSWSVTGAASLSIDNGVGDVTNQRSFTVSPTTTTIYTLTAANPSGSTTATVQVTVTPVIMIAPVPASNLTGSSPSTTSVILSWQDNSNNETGFIIQRSTGGNSFATIRTVPANVITYADSSLVAGLYDYQVIATNAAGNANPSNIVSVQVLPAEPRIVFFSASPASITRAQSSTLSWSVTGATALSIDNGVGDVANVTSFTVSPTTTTIYTLTATNSAGAVTATAQVTVMPPTPLPIPLFDLPSSITLDDSLTVSYPSGFNVTGYLWILTALSTSSVTNPGGSPPVKILPGGAVLKLGKLGLTPGDYNIQVAAQIDITTISPSASGVTHLRGSLTTTSALSASSSRVLVYPNPWRQNKHHGEPLYFTGLPDGSTLKIFTLSGHYITTLTFTAFKASWDPSSAASGIYLYHATDSQGGTFKGKFAIIH
jgi:hypothetical protein